MVAIEKISLFEGIKESDLPELLTCLLARKRMFNKNEFIFQRGEAAENTGIILSGSAHVMKEDFWGKRSILTKIEEGELFGEVFAGRGLEKLPVSVAAVEPSEILFINNKRISSPCASVCAFHAKLIQNMLKILAEKNIMLINKLEHVGKRTIREKLLSYLSEQAVKQGGNAFEIPFNRQELADYLAVDRSAMSRELGKLQKEGILEFYKSTFRLCGREAHSHRKQS